MRLVSEFSGVVKMLPAKSDAIANSRKGPPYAFLTLNSYASQCEDGKSVNEWNSETLVRSAGGRDPPPGRL